jgi:hypothetical protein
VVRTTFSVQRKAERFIFPTVGIPDMNDCFGLDRDIKVEVVSKEVPGWSLDSPEPTLYVSFK